MPPVVSEGKEITAAQLDVLYSKYKGSGRVKGFVRMVFSELPGFELRGYSVLGVGSGYEMIEGVSQVELDCETGGRYGILKVYCVYLLLLDEKPVGIKATYCIDSMELSARECVSRVIFFEKRGVTAVKTGSYGERTRDGLLDIKQYRVEEVVDVPVVPELKDLVREVFKWELERLGVQL